MKKDLKRLLKTPKASTNKVSRLKRFQCKKCNIMFSDNHALKMHVDMVHEKKILLIKNKKICGFTSMNKSPVDISSNNAHLKIQPFECPCCDKKYEHDKTLKRHIKECHGEKKEFQCDICDTIFHRNENLKNHILSVHEKQKPFQCNICNDNFSTKTNLKKHISRRH